MSTADLLSVAPQEACWSWAPCVRPPPTGFQRQALPPPKRVKQKVEDVIANVSAAALDAEDGEPHLKILKGKSLLIYNTPASKYQSDVKIKIISARQVDAQARPGQRAERPGGRAGQTTEWKGC